MVDNIKRVIAQIQDFFDSSLNPLLDDIFNQGTLVTVRLLASQTNLVDHKLAHKYTGYFIVDKDATCDIWSSPTLIKPELYLTLLTSADVNVTIRCF